MKFRTDSFLPGRTRRANSRTVDRRAYITLSSMPDQTYLVTLRSPSRAMQQVFAATAEVRGNHLVFLDAKGNFAAFFLRDLVESWNVLPSETTGNGAAGSKGGKAVARAVGGRPRLRGRPHRWSDDANGAETHPAPCCPQRRASDRRSNGLFYRVGCHETLRLTCARFFNSPMLFRSGSLTSSVAARLSAQPKGKRAVSAAVHLLVNDAV
jgi:hypothetical protein